MTTPPQKRRHLRLSHQATVQLHYAGQTVIGLTRDISESGLMVEAVFPKQPAIGETLEILILDIPDGVKRPVIVRRLVTVPVSGYAVEYI
jgi:hypothetical protein